MSFTLEIRKPATIEMLDAYEWYEAQQVGLGVKFFESLEAFYNNLLKNPNIHSFYKEPVKQGSLNKFPYTVVYEVFEDTIIIYSIFMQKRDPASKRTK